MVSRRFWMSLGFPCLLLMMGLSLGLSLTSSLGYTDDPDLPEQPLPPANLNGQVQYQQPQVLQQSAAPQGGYAQTSDGIPAAELLKVTKQPGNPGHYSPKKYQAVTITLQNTQASHLELLQAEVPMALDEQALAIEKAESAQKKKKAAGFLLRAASVVPGYAMMGVSSYGGALAVAHTTNALSHASYIVDNTPTGDLSISGRFVQRVNNIVISPNQTFTFTALLPKAIDPVVKVVFKNLQTNQIFDIQQ